MKRTTWNVALVMSLVMPMSRVASAANPSGQNATKKDAGSSSAVPAGEAQELDFATRGFIATLDQPKILRADGQVAWDLDLASQFQGPAPATVNSNLWEQAKLLVIAGFSRSLTMSTRCADSMQPT
jgi:alkyl sulfatase BDS1-like metallo-beta-lactamase superfamily hydrolase